MAGIYFHIPFCKSKCNYCDFYSGINLTLIDDLVKSEILEVYLRKVYLKNEIINTIYFGGGTPSLLSVSQIKILIDCVKSNFIVSESCEITLEANPEDLDSSFLDNLFDIGVNRLSIGIQSFNDKILSFLGRNHDSSILKTAINTAKNSGFNNISIDLIYGIPGLSINDYIFSIQEVLDLNIQHISAYALTFEKGTKLYKLLNDRKILEMPEQEVIDQFNATIDILAAGGFEQYEVSNFACDNNISRHNSSYWNNVNYLGIGPSAHSYDGISRQWNVSSTRKYCSLVSLAQSFFELEILTETDKYNEYLLTGLRTCQGISLKYICENFQDRYFFHFNQRIDKLVSDKIINENSGIFSLTRQGMLLSDFVIRFLFYS